MVRTWRAASMALVGVLLAGVMGPWAPAGVSAAPARTVGTPDATPADTEPLPAPLIPRVTGTGPDPVTFLPMAPAEGRAHRPEAVLGYGSRGEDPKAAEQPQAPAPAPAPTANPTPQPTAAPALPTPAPAVPSAPAVPAASPAGPVPVPAAGTGTLSVTVNGGAIGTEVQIADGDPAHNQSVYQYYVSGPYVFTAAEGTWTIHVQDAFGDTARGYWCGTVHLCTTLAEATAVAVTAGATTSITIQLDPAPVISGTILASDGTPAIGALVGLDGVYASTSVAYDGTFSLKAQPGSHKLYATIGSGKPGGFYAIAGPNHWTQLISNGADLVTAAGTSVNGLSMRLPTYRTISGTTGDRTGATMGYGAISLNQGADVVAWAYANASGAFSVQAPQGGQYTLGTFGACPNLDAWYTSGPPYYSLTQGSATVVTVGSVDIGGITTRTATCPTVTGTITTHTGAPLATGAVYATGVDGTSGSHSTTVNADGTYTLYLDPGTWIISASDASGADAGGYYTSGGWVLNDTDAEHLAVTMSGRTSINLQLPAWRTITGTVTDPDGAPVAGIAMYPNWSGWSYTDAGGAYSLKVPPGSWVVQVGAGAHTRGGYLGAGGAIVQSYADGVPVSAVAGNVANLDITAPFWRRVTGTVKGTAGEPLTGVHVSFWYGSYGYPEVSTGADGTYTIWITEDSSLGAHQLKADLPDVYDAVIRDIVLSPADLPGQDFTLARFPAVTGTITDTAGTPIPNIAVFGTYGTGYYDYRTVYTDEAGHYRLAFPMGGTLDSITVQLSDRYAYGNPVHVPGYLGPDGYSKTGTTFSLAAEEVRDADIVMPTYRYLTGVLRGPDGTPVPSIRLDVYDPDSHVFPISTTWTAGNGGFSLKVPPGPWYVEVTSPWPYASGWLGTEGFGYTATPSTVLDMPDQDLTRDILLPATLHISGQVRTTAAATSSIEVDILREGAAYTKTYADSDGHWTADVAPGAYTIGFYDPDKGNQHGYLGIAGFTLNPAAAKLVVVGTADATGQDVTLPRNSVITGTVKNTAGKASPYVYVEAWVNGVYYDQVWTNGSGVYSLRVPPGNVKLWIYDAYLKVAPGWRTATSLTADPSKALLAKVGTAAFRGANIVAPAPRFITGTTRGINQTGTNVIVKKVWLTVVAFGATASLGQSSSTGTFKLPVLPGTYTIWAETTGTFNDMTLPFAGGWYRTGVVGARSTHAAKVTPPAAGSRITITLARSGVVAANLRSRLETIVDGVAVVFVNGEVYDAANTQDGLAQIAVPAGTYTLGVYDPFGIYRDGWWLDDGDGGDHFTTDAVSASPIVITAGNGGGGAMFLPADTAPGHPNGVSAVPYHASALVSLTKPLSPAWRPIIGSTVTAHPGLRQCTTTGTSCMVTGLTDGVAYTFTATSTSNVGTSLASSASSPVTPLAVPGAAAAPGVVAARNTPTVAWVAPADNGNAITGYVVTASPDGATCVAAADATECQFDPLPDGWYTFSVVASNALGAGPVSPSGVAAPADVTAPSLAAPVVALQSGVPMSAALIPVRVTWAASDATSGLASSSLELDSGAGYVAQTLSGAAVTAWDGALAPGATTYRLRATVADALGNAPASPAEGPAFTVAVREETVAGTSVTGTWTSLASAGASGGRLRYATAAGASFSYRFTGRAVAWVSRMSWTGGTASVYLDGVKVGSVSLYGSPVGRYVAWSRVIPAGGTHTVKIVVVSGRVDVDAFEVIQ